MSCEKHHKKYELSVANLGCEVLESMIRRVELEVKIKDIERKIAKEMRNALLKSSLDHAQTSVAEKEVDSAEEGFNSQNRYKKS